MTPQEILHDALQQCIEASEQTEYDVQFWYSPHVNTYSVSVSKKGWHGVVWSRYCVDLTEQAHQEAMKAMAEFTGYGG